MGGRGREGEKWNKRVRDSEGDNKMEERARGSSDEREGNRTRAKASNGR